MLLLKRALTPRYSVARFKKTMLSILLYTGGKSVAGSCYMSTNPSPGHLGVRLLPLIIHLEGFWLGGENRLLDICVWFVNPNNLI